VRETHGTEHVLLGEDLIPLKDLAVELGFPRRPRERRATAILVGHDDERVAFTVGQIVAQEEVVVKPLGPPLSDYGFLAGAALLADGRTAYILEPARLTER
jgi:two-component system chemotaxis sensor kinase CheA